MRNEFYQDVWIRGNIVKQGDRPCQSRYGALSNFLARYLSPVRRFEVLDFGANMGYFSFNTAYNFPGSHVTMVDYEPLLPCLHKLNGLPNVDLVHAYVDLLDDFLEDKYYDVIYAMSVLHHFEDYREAIDLFISHADNVVFEVGYPDEVPEVNEDRVPGIYNYIMGKNPIQINSHMEHDRPIYYVNDSERAIETEVYCGAKMASKKTFPEIEYPIQHTFGQKFYPGTLNLKTEKLKLKNPFWIAEVYKVYPAYLNGLPVYILRTEQHPETSAEIISPHCLREKLNLKDGDNPTLSIDKEYLSP